MCINKIKKWLWRSETTFGTMSEPVAPPSLSDYDSSVFLTDFSSLLHYKHKLFPRFYPHAFSNLSPLYCTCCLQSYHRILQREVSLLHMWSPCLVSCSSALLSIGLPDICDRPLYLSFQIPWQWNKLSMSKNGTQDTKRTKMWTCSRETTGYQERHRNK